MADTKPSAKAAGATHHGLRLSLPGAPLTPHVIPGVNGWFMPHVATPVGGPGDLPLEFAKRLADDPSVHLELVELTADEAEEARAHQEVVRTGSRQGVIAATKAGPDGAEVEQVAAERTMTASRS